MIIRARRTATGQIRTEPTIALMATTRATLGKDPAAAMITTMAKEIRMMMTTTMSETCGNSRGCCSLCFEGRRAFAGTHQQVDSGLGAQGVEPEV
jgi:hypothetical protein